MLYASLLVQSRDNPGVEAEAVAHMKHQPPSQWTHQEDTVHIKKRRERLAQFK